MGIELDRAAAGPAHVPISRSLPFHWESLREVHAPADVLFPYLDDHAQLSAHMSKSSWMMLGSRMAIELDASQGRAVGAHIHLDGRVSGIPLSVEEVVIERQPPLRKVWQTVGIPRLLVIGDYRMGFEIRPQASSVSLRVFIDYALPTKFPGSVLGPLLGAFYARWCTASRHKTLQTTFPARSPDMGRKASFWTSRTFLTALALSAAGTVFLLSGHRAHLLGAIPYLFLLACPLMHFLGGHGSHRHHDQTHRWPGDEEEHL